VRSGAGDDGQVLSRVEACFLGASSWRFRRCSSPGISPSVHNRRGFGARVRAFRETDCGVVYNVGGGPHFRARLTIDTAAELHADGFSAR
jgi:hypothetical protein